MNILFRADSSSSIGTGHIMRDLVLASKYKNQSIHFAVRELKGNINHKIKQAGFQLSILKDNTYEKLQSMIKKLDIDMIIIDHYEIDYKFEKRLKEENPHLKIMVLDDTYEKHYCDILLNHNIGAKKKKYLNLLPSHCTIKCGSKYTLLREEFFKEKKTIQKKQFKKNNSKKTIFIAMGGVDNTSANIPILKILKRHYRNIQVNLLTTTANSNLKVLKKYCMNKKWITLHINSQSVAKLMSQSDLAIVTPSVTANEVIFLQIPLIAIKTASNQIDIYNYLKANGYDVFDNLNPNKIEKKIQYHLKFIV